ncbi:MAG: TerC family protein [Candidatus Kryptonium sp.]|nr:TerC family protein [Candidatus Kryptonium sp.]MCX7761789.1 TerC family protein [Candidatus Kryptonium sp.]
MHLTETLMWILFNVFVLGMLALDLGVFHRKAHEVKFKEAVIWSIVWIALALAFNVLVYFWHGTQSALEFLTGYLVEKSLSVDNIFVFLMIFTYFGVSPMYQHKVLFWGILGAIIMRAIFIFAGVTLIKIFHPIIYIFGAFLIFTGIKMGLQKDREIHPERNPVLKVFRKFFSITPDYVDGKFFVRQGKKLIATPLFVVLLVVESTDVVFAVDSIPAIIAITRDPFIVYTSNIFAILGLRALYFAIAGFVKLFRYFKYGLSIVLVFIGIKMLISDFYKIPTVIALITVFSIITISILASIIIPEPRPALNPAGNPGEKEKENKS